VYGRCLSYVKMTLKLTLMGKVGLVLGVAWMEVNLSQILIDERKPSLHIGTQNKHINMLT